MARPVPARVVTSTGQNEPAETSGSSWGGKEAIVRTSPVVSRSITTMSPCSVSATIRAGGSPDASGVGELDGVVGGSGEARLRNGGPSEHPARRAAVRTTVTALLIDITEGRRIFSFPGSNEPTSLRAPRRDASLPVHAPEAVGHVLRRLSVERHVDVSRVVHEEEVLPRRVGLHHPPAAPHDRAELLPAVGVDRDDPGARRIGPAAALGHQESTGPHVVADAPPLRASHERLDL